MASTSWYRRRYWQMKGKREYTSSGYENASSRFSLKALDMDCSSQHFLITGANSGIGLQTATQIARRGGILHLVCRNRSSMVEARSHIITTTGNDKIYMHTLDLSRPRDVSRWAQDFVAAHEQLDVLINNAGSFFSERQYDEDGIEATFAIHCLSPHILTLTLLPLLHKSTDPRVIFVSSAGMLQVKLDPHDLLFEKMSPFDGHLAYAQTKRQQVVLNLTYAQMYENVRFYSMHPGWVDTAMRENFADVYQEVKGNLRTIEEGADTVIWLAVSSDALRHSSGLFFQDRAPIPTHLPFAWTKHSFEDEQLLLKKINYLLLQVSATEQSSAISNATEGFNNFIKCKSPKSKLSSKPEDNSLLEGKSNDNLGAKKDLGFISSRKDSSLQSSLELESNSSSSLDLPPDEYNMPSLSSPNDLDFTAMKSYARDRLESIPEVSGESMNERFDDVNLSTSEDGDLENYPNRKAKILRKERDAAAALHHDNNIINAQDLVLDSRIRPIVIPQLPTAPKASLRQPTSSVATVEDRTNEDLNKKVEVLPSKTETTISIKENVASESYLQDSKENMR